MWRLLLNYVRRRRFQKRRWSLPGDAWLTISSVRRYVEALGASLQIIIVPDAHAVDNPIGLPPKGLRTTVDAWQGDVFVREPQEEYTIHDPST
ncbi:MAG: hypothetical protein KJZ95_23275 [Caldilinea sp.]|nr:hypothetical protein [Caldilinea sp.]